ncbi:LOW QUALITY PROTEIN: solute carrier family 52, riboflavin transporter, member 3-B-like [Haliotis rubra]|uniref:LOW QUALITY PROTEIN: solute carrier family 52, riboflavin transporter, member 3-B-like n=1 Tax=Haliotis rubra TaxID=36100 RepID=UPI001EE5E56B|nr:LOW QUALITY PROTEIN: solute carrier family 52, riboflavin transporter, member 3-B-like [Haliotis rubra]
MGLRQLLSESKLLVHFLVCCFGIASWVDINGVWVELPLLVTTLPEGWTLPSYIIIISQVANIGPITFAVLVYCYKDAKLENPVSALIIVIGMASCMLLAFFWKETTVVAGEPHSTALLALNLVLALVDCTSSLAFLAFMASLKPHYLPTFFIGEGLSGLIPGLTALGQGAGSISCANGSHVSSNFTNGTWYNETVASSYPVFGTPRFSVQVFFFILFGLMVLSLMSFILLNYLPYCKSERVAKYVLEINTVNEESRKNAYTACNPIYESDKFKGETSQQSVTTKTPNKVISPRRPSVSSLPKQSSLILITSFLLSVQSYTSIPYGLDTYHLVAIITNIANPVACFFSLALPVTGTIAISILSFSGTGFGIYLIVVAAMSPHPPLYDVEAGGAIVITSWAMASFLLTYAKVSIAGRLRQGGRQPLIWYGAFTQTGALIGAIAAFLVVNIFKLLQDAPYC